RSCAILVSVLVRRRLTPLCGGRPNNPPAQAPFSRNAPLSLSGDVARWRALLGRAPLVFCSPASGCGFAPSQLNRDDDHLFPLVPAANRWGTPRSSPPRASIHL